MCALGGNFVAPGMPSAAGWRADSSWHEDDDGAARFVLAGYVEGPELGHVARCLASRGTVVEVEVVVVGGTVSRWKWSWWEMGRGSSATATPTGVPPHCDGGHHRVGGGVDDPHGV